ncbi:MAG TPA: SGNH/GDSL hydrolase family protein [Actinophytocola sp.]|uniref:SGNH/GDSL hydrolase family protein n=1 Tax=Actinophytocola sp. TaxID=1872138 RepID=UPI002DBCD82F|nr:SGNH/GDSL hydrolase family protein [Actinophytocola sp.]HEU5474148.1 SGNH/GDSL hydrolase family protein [Actinophytocola sp.]
MRVFRLLMIPLLALVGVLAFAVPAQAAAGKYVALGDSYSSGTGAGSYGSSGACKRSANSYPQRWANAMAPSAFTFAACSGARTGDILNAQVNSVTADTALVTISIGGNDAGFADVMITCNTSSDSTCVSRNNTAQNYARNTLPGQLDTVYRAIDARAPSARVIVVGYPRMYRLGGGCVLGLSDTKRAAINASADVLAQVTAARAAAFGFDFLDARNAFSGHEICATRPYWLHSINLGAVDESYHPTATGQGSGYYPALRAITG